MATAYGGVPLEAVTGSSRKREKETRRGINTRTGAG